MESTISPPRRRSIAIQKISWLPTKTFSIQTWFLFVKVTLNIQFVNVTLTNCIFTRIFLFREPHYIRVMLLFWQYSPYICWSYFPLNSESGKPVGGKIFISNFNQDIQLQRNWQKYSRSFRRLVSVIVRIIGVYSEYSFKLFNQFQQIRKLSTISFLEYH